MIRLKIDNNDLEVKEGTTILMAAREAGITIPSMCFLEGHSNHPSCMVCLVKDNRNGAMVPSCAMTATNGMDISASSPDVMEARKKALELLMSDHVGDCEAPCSLACPAGMDIPLMNRLLGEARFSEALDVVKNDIALPYILGYICPAPCEKACRRKQVDEPVSVCLLKRISAAAGTDGKVVSAASTLPSGRKVAIIGSGPAGLAAAYYLQLSGHACTLFDKETAAGGTLRHSIPDEELPKEIIDTEVEIIKSLGASFRLNTPVTAAFFHNDIKDHFDAVIVATGDIGADNSLAEIIGSAKAGYLTDDRNMSSTVTGIFVCGSAIRSHKMAVRSVAQGKTAAEAVNNYLKGLHYEKPGKMFNSRFDKLQQIEFDEYLKESVPTGRHTPLKGYLGGFSAEEAVNEAKRCLHCDCRKKDNCRLREHSETYKIDRKRFATGERQVMTKQMQHDFVVYEPEKCIKCGLCVEISAGESKSYGLAFEGRGFDVFVNPPLGVSLGEGLDETAVSCIRACPTGALSFRNEQQPDNKER